MPSKNKIGFVLTGDDVKWGYDNKPQQEKKCVEESVTALEENLLKDRVLPELLKLGQKAPPVHMTGHSLGGVITRAWILRTQESQDQGQPPPTALILARYVTFDGVHGGTTLANGISKLLTEYSMNGHFKKNVVKPQTGWNSSRKLGTSPNTLLFASVADDTINPSASAFGVGRVMLADLKTPSQKTLRSVGGWELAVPNREHSIQNDPVVFVSTGRYLAGHPAALGTKNDPGGTGTKAKLSGSSNERAPASFPRDATGTPSPGVHTVELNATAGTTATAPLYPGTTQVASFSALLAGDASLTVHDSGGLELAQLNFENGLFAPDIVSICFEVDLPGSGAELRLNANSTDAFAFVSIEYSSDVSGSVEVDLADYQAGDPVLVTAVLKDAVDTALVGTAAFAESTVSLADGTTMALTLFDDGTHNDGAAGDGVFGNTFTETDEAGRYGVSVELTADLLGATHRRTDATLFYVIPESASFVGSFVESLLDEDSNGLAEAIELTFTVDAFEAGEYVVHLEVIDSGGTTLDFLRSRFEVTTVPSQVPVTITIDSLTVHLAGGGDPLVLRSIALVDLNAGLNADALPDGVTQSYSLGEFEIPDAPVLSHIFPGDVYENGGDEVILYGQNLVHATGVFVGGVSALEFQAVSDTSIAVTVPAGLCGPTTVQVTTPWGDTTQEGIFNYLCNVQPEIINQPTADLNCESNSVSLLVIAAGTTPLNYQWRKDGFDMPDETDSFLVVEDFTVDDQGNYDVMVTNFLGSVPSAGAEIFACNATNRPDACDIADETSADCQPNGVPDECDIGAGSEDTDGNGIPDECGSPVSPPLPASEPHDIRKNRFVSFKPNGDGLQVAFRVELLDLTCSVTGQKCNNEADCKICDANSNNPGEACTINSVCTGGNCVISGETCDQQSPPVLLGWVGDPVEAGGDALPETFTSEVITTQPTPRTWPESVVHIGDCEIAPVRTYAISATTDGLVFSDPLVVGTIEKPQGKDWGDIVGNFDGVVWSAPKRAGGCGRC